MLTELITPMVFVEVRDAIAEHLAKVRDSQIEIAQNEGESEDTITEEIDFTIYPKRFRFPNIEEMPCVYIYFNEMEYPEDEQDVYEYPAKGILNIEIYTVGENSETSSTTADNNASDRLEYLTAQIFKTLCSEETNVYDATNKLIKSFRALKWRRIATPDEINEARTVLGAVLEFAVEFDETTVYASTTEIKDFYTTLTIRDEFISPFIRKIIEDSDDETDEDSDETDDETDEDSDDETESDDE